MYIRVLCTIIYQSDDLALSASDSSYMPRVLAMYAAFAMAYLLGRWYDHPRLGSVHV